MVSLLKFLQRWPSSHFSYYMKECASHLIMKFELILPYIFVTCRKNSEMTLIQKLLLIDARLKVSTFSNRILQITNTGQAQVLVKAKARWRNWSNFPEFIICLLIIVLVLSSLLPREYKLIRCRCYFTFSDTKNSCLSSSDFRDQREHRWIHRRLLAQNCKYSRFIDFRYERWGDNS